MAIPRTDFIQRISKYCAEAERCTHDVKVKLISWEISSDEADIIIEKLRKENFLDDERYTKSYVSEKWNLDHWGRIKIENNLIQKQIPEGIIRYTLSTIDEDEYKIYLEDLLKQKLREVRSDNFMDDARRVHMYAVSKGFENELVKQWLENQE